MTSAPPPAKIRAEKLGVRFRGGLEVLRDASFEVSSGEFVVLVGPSGCGKTTLLDAVAAHLPPEKAELSGRILIDGRELRPGAGWPGPLGYVSQKDTLFPWRTVLENVASGLEIQGVAKAERLDRARGLMALAGLSGFEHYFPGQISGGMRQRASLIRTLAYDPEVILMDEPFGALDAQTRMNLQGELIRIWARSRKTILFVTHDLAEAITLGERLILLSRRPGSVTRVCPIPVPHPRDPFRFYGSPEFTELEARLWKSVAAEFRQDPEEAPVEERA